MKSLDELSHFLKQYDTDEQTPKKRPPVDQWHPTEELQMDIVIKSNGEWWHEGSKMTRTKLVSLFASILVVEDDDYFLKTPVQKVKLVVEDAPLLVNDVAVVANETTNNSDDYWLEFRTTTDDVIRLDDTHVPYFKTYQDEVRPYIAVRDGLHALLSRPVYYHLMELGELVEQDGQTLMCINSGGQVFKVLYPEG